MSELAMNQVKKELLELISQVIDHYDVIASYCTHAKFHPDERKLMNQMAIIGLLQIDEQVDEMIKLKKELKLELK